MANFLNDLNKMVNTIQKVDKLLTEKPKRTRVQLHNVKFTKQELSFLRHVVNFYGEECYNMDAEDKKLHTKIFNKLMNVV